MNGSSPRDLCRAAVRALLVTAALCAVPGCGGTETGNPGPAPIDGGPLFPADNPAIGLMSALCGKLTSCLEGLDESGCRTSVGVSRTLGERFGAAEDQYPTFIDVIAAAEAEALRTDGAQFELCTAAIAGLPCDSEEIQAVQFQDSELTNLEQMVPDEGCPNVFSPAP